MKILFIYMGAESLGVEYLAAEARRAGHEVDLAFDPAVFGGRLMWDIPALARVFDLRPKIIRKILSDKPDVAAFSCFTGNYIWSLEIANEIKKAAPEIRTIFGGVHVTAAPQRVIAEKSVDAIIAGEADTAFPALLEEWKRGGGAEEKIPGVWVKREGEIITGGPQRRQEDLDSLPFPAKDLFYDRVPALERHYMIMSARGCPYNCTYCYKSLTASFDPGSKSVKRRSPGNVIAELEPVKARGRAKMIVFRDDVFTLQKKWLEEFAESYKKKIGIPYFCYTHPAALDEASADFLMESGCVFVTMGVQSADENQRREVLNRKYTNDQVRQTVSIIKKRGISLSVDHIIGVPGDTVEILEKAAVFYNELRPDRLLTFWLEYYPGTEILEIASRRGLVGEKEREAIESGRTGHRYSGGGAAGGSPHFRKLAVLFSLIPLLPQGLVRFIMAKRLWRLLPGAYAINNLLLFINAIRTGDEFFKYNLNFFLSVKKTP